MIVLLIYEHTLLKGLPIVRILYPVVLGYASVNILSCIIETHACIYLACKL